MNASAAVVHHDCKVGKYLIMPQTLKLEREHCEVSRSSLLVLPSKFGVEYTLESGSERLESKGVLAKLRQWQGCEDYCQKICQDREKDTAEAEKRLTTTLTCASGARVTSLDHIQMVWADIPRHKA
jgi:hypothetical protein